MPPASLATARLRLVPATADLLRADLAGPGPLAASLGAVVPPDWPPPLLGPEALRHALLVLPPLPPSGDAADGDWWWSWYVLRVPPPGTRPATVGIVGWKGPPDRWGTVEIGYSFVPSVARQGFATEACRALLDRAFASGAVRRVAAHTLPGHASSIRLLERLGFAPAGDGVDPDGGRVRRYLRRR